MISIRKPLSFSEIGRKDNQEDYLYPAHADERTRVFILCDGMGGHDKGEVASMTAGCALGEYLSARGDVKKETFEAGLEKAYDALDSITVVESEKKPGTTMTCLCLNSDNYLVAHIGDSRIYHIRPSLYDPRKKQGGILYQSSDHSLVNDLLKAGELTQEEAQAFPHKNVITRAMQPMSARSRAETYTFDNVAGGDYFFLCSDGVMEQLSNTSLCSILSEKCSDNEKIDKIRSICDGNTRDNYSCWLIPIGNVSGIGSNVHDYVIKADIEAPEQRSFFRKLLHRIVNNQNQSEK